MRHSVVITGLMIRYRGDNMVCNLCGTAKAWHNGFCGRCCELIENEGDLTKKEQELLDWLRDKKQMS